MTYRPPLAPLVRIENEKSLQGTARIVPSEPHLDRGQTLSFEGAREFRMR